MVKASRRNSFESRMGKSSNLGMLVREATKRIVLVFENLFLVIPNSLQEQVLNVFSSSFNKSLSSFSDVGGPEPFEAHPHLSPFSSSSDQDSCFPSHVEHRSFLCSNSSFRMSEECTIAPLLCTFCVSFPQQFLCS